MAHFVLVHGMYHGGWCWDRLKARLEAAGHRVDAPDLAGCGRDPTPAVEVTLDGWAIQIADLVAAAGEPVILVGHSRGGLVVSQASERTHHNVAALVYLTALLLPDGATAMSLPAIMAEQGFEYRPPAMTMQLDAEGLRALVPVEAGDIFYGACSAKDRAWARPQLTAEPIAPLGQPQALSEACWGSLPRIVIETTEDQTLSIDAQRAMHAHVGATELHSLDADHMPMFTHAEALATILEDIAHRHPPIATLPSPSLSARN